MKNNADQPERIAALEAENRLLEEELDKVRVSEQRFLRALQLSPMALCHHDRDLRYTWLYNAHMGFVQDDVIGLTDWDILDPDLADRMGEVKRRVLNTGIGVRTEMQTVAGDENCEYFDLVVEPLKDEESGEIIGLSCSGIDVTEDRRRREAYKASEENLRFIFNASLQPIIVSRQNDSFPLFYNKAAGDLFHLDKTEDVFSWLDLRDELDAKLARFETVKDHKFIFINERGDRHYMMASFTKTFYDGEAAVLSSFQDLTKEVIYQKSLESAKEKAELASLAKSHFLASASHDLRQPLHAMGLLLSVLEQYVDNPDGQAVLERVTGSLETMNDLFSGILDISKLDAKAVPLKMEAVHIKACFEKLKREFAPLADQKNIDLRFVSCDVYVQTDHVQLERLLRNLISNALRYTDHGGRVLVGVRHRKHRVAFYVYDNGMGIAQPDQRLIFEEFRQIGNAERDRRKGLGLGLAICERIASLLETNIELASEPQKGAVFWFDLSRALTPQKKKDLSEPGKVVSLNGCRVMFIEDEVDVQVATRFMLQAWECVPQVAGSLAEALKLWEESGERPDVIVADYRLSEQENGLDTILHLRAEMEKEIPAVILSGDTSTQLIRQLDELGLHLLNKPLMPKDLKEHLIFLLSQ